MTPKKQFLFFMTAVIVLSAILHNFSRNFPDPDVFYHFRHASLYADKGVTFADFPWTQYSVIHKFSADIWYGFHLFVAPFTFFEDEVFGMRLAGLFVTLTALLLFYFALKRIKIKWPEFWPFLLIFSSPFVLYRFTMLRPHLLSLGLSALFYVFLIQSSFFGVFLTSFFISFLHIGLFWAPVLIFGVVSAVKLTQTRFGSILQSGLAMSAGLLAGWLLRPNPFGALRVVKIQIFDLLLARQGDIPLNFGMELFVMPISGLLPFSLFIIVWLAAIFIFFRVQKKNVFEISSLTLSITFFLMTMFVAQRSFDFWIMFGVLFVALVFSDYLAKKDIYKYALIGIFVIMFIYAPYSHSKNITQYGWDADRFRPASEWLKENSEEGDIVFNVAWEYFPELFFWNTKNYYISGMDPIFQYVYSPELYWKAYYLETGKTAGFTCAATFCEEKDFEDTHDVLMNDFGASYVFVSRPADENLYDYFLSDSGYSFGYEDVNSAVFKILELQ